MTARYPILGRGALCRPPGAPLQAAPGSVLARAGRVDRLCALSLVAAEEALAGAAAAGHRALRADRAGPDGPDGEARADVGVVFGSAYGCHEDDEAYYRDLLRSGTPPMGSPRLFVYTLPSSPAGEISIHFGLRGPALAVVSGLQSGLAALGQARRALGRGRAALVLACAAEVATPLLGELEGAAQVREDGAAALLLGAADDADAAPLGHLGHLGPVAGAYRAGDPAAALHAAIDQVLGEGAASAAPERAFGDEATLGLLPAGALPCAAEALVPPGRGAYGALAAMASLSSHGHGSALLLQADPRGHGAAALWLR